MKYDYTNDDNTDMELVINCTKAGVCHYKETEKHGWMDYYGGNIYRDDCDEPYYNVRVDGREYMIPWEQYADITFIQYSE